MESKLMKFMLVTQVFALVYLLLSRYIPKSQLQPQRNQNLQDHTINNLIASKKGFLLSLNAKQHNDEYNKEDSYNNYSKHYNDLDIKSYSKYFIISLNIGSIYGLQSVSIMQNHHCYAKTHGYHYKVFDDETLSDIMNHSKFDPLRTKYCRDNPAYYKPIILNYMFTNDGYKKSFEYIFFIDHDALFTNLKLSIDDMLAIFDKKYTNNVSFVWSRKGHLINSGVLLLKNTEFIYKNIIKILFNMTKDVCDYDGDIQFSHWDQSLLTLIFKGCSYQYCWKEQLLDHVKLYKHDIIQTRIDKMTKQDCKYDNYHKITAYTTNDYIIENCIDKRLQPYALILDHTIFNCIPSFDDFQMENHPCMQFIAHFAGKSKIERKQLIETTVQIVSSQYNSC